MWPNAKESFWEAINEWLEQMATDLSKEGLNLASTYIQDGMKLSQVPFFSYIMLTVQMLAGGLFIITLYKQILTAMKEDMIDEADPNWLAIVGNAAVSAGMVWITPYLIRDYLIPISNEIVDYLAKAPVEWNVGVDGIKRSLAPDASLATAGLHLLLGFLVWAIGMVALVISQMITYAQIAVAMWVGPLLATQYQNRSEVFSTYWREVIALVFTPVLRMALFIGVIAMVAKGTLDGILWSIGFIIIAVIGPSVLKGYLHRTGTGTGLYRTLLASFRQFRK